MTDRKAYIFEGEIGRMERNRPAGPKLSRRRYLAAGGAATTFALAGCATAVDWVFGHALEEVNVLNDADSEVAGRITVTGPDGGALNEAFDLGPSDEDDPEEANIQTYDDIWTDAGTYEVTVDLETELDGTRTGSETVPIDDPDEELLIVALGVEEIEAPIAFGVGDGFTDAWPGDG